MRNNRGGGIGRVLIVLIVVAALFFVVSNVGVENITNKANSTLDSFLSKGTEQIGNISNKKDKEKVIDYKSDRPYKDSNQEVLAGLEKSIKEYDTNREGFSVKDFKKDNKYSLIKDEYVKNWEDFDKDNCSTYKAALITLGENVKVEENCDIVEGSWKDQYVNDNQEKEDKDKTKENKDNKKDKSTKSKTTSSTISSKKKNKSSAIDDNDYHNFVVDHVVPLENVWDSGYGQLDMGMKIGVANDRINMMVTTPGTNKDKGIKTIDKWTPEKDSKYYCDYADRYGLIKLNYSLSVTQSEYDALKEIYSVCNK